MAQFSNTQQVIVQGGTFNSARGDIHIVHQNSGYSESGFHILRLAVSHGAIHDSAERYPPPNCHPDTRKAVRQVILDWIHDKSSGLPFLWLYGPAGAGKTAILQAIAESLCNSSECDGDLGGSFFFSRGKYGRDQGHFLFSTIAYQLALNVPGLRQHINYIMERNPTLHTKSITVQLQTLIVDAFQSLSPPPQRSYLVIIDGLDECQDKATQQLILRLLCEAITARKLPFRFLIGSRPESHIRASFDEKSLYTITKRVVLDETFNPARDIQVFLQDGFAGICIKHADILSHVEQPWPGEGIIHLLVQRSSGQFIYSATVLKFVGADFCSPTKQLALILKPDPSAFSDLDQLYTQILSVYPSTTNIVQVLGIIAALDVRNLTPEVIEDILGMEEGEVKLVLRGLSSLITFVGDGNEKYSAKRDGSVHLIHASFRDYLVDSRRSGPFHVNIQEYKNQATTWSFALITKLIGKSWRAPSTRLPHTETWNYFESYFANDFIESPKLVKDAIMTDINDLVQEFWKISSGGVADVFFTAMHCLLDNLQVVLLQIRVNPDLETDYDEFLMMFHRYQKMLDQSFTSALSKSKDIVDMLRLLPGIVVQKGLTMQGMGDLYRVKLSLLKRLSKWTLEPFFKGIIPSNMNTLPSYILDKYLSGFLQNRDRSHFHYCDPMLHHVFICRQFLSLLDARSNAPDLQSCDLPEYVRSNLHQHLCAATEIFLSGQNIPNDHPAMEILDDLDRITYSHLDANQSPCRSYLAQFTIQSILTWANDMLNNHLEGTNVSISDSTLIKRMHQITDRIYRQVLRVETHGTMTTVTILIHGPVTPPCKPANPGVVQISWELLTWASLRNRIPSFFTDFMTTPERSGCLHISPDAYHTQITEYSLRTIFRYNKSNSFRPSHFTLDNDLYLLPDWSFQEHISRALPTEMILHLLRSVHSCHLIRAYCPESMINLLEIIIKWLEGLGSERPNDLFDRFQGELHQRKPALMSANRRPYHKQPKPDTVVNRIRTCK